LGIAALEDKIVQQAVVTVLNQIYEEDFLGFSYGFRPGRSQHDALDALWVGLMRKKVNWILDADPASAPKRALRRQISEVGAVCSNPARTDLCGGRRVTGVPTAKRALNPVTC
jgi:hypothetical protein